MQDKREQGQARHVVLVGAKAEETAKVKVSERVSKWRGLWMKAPTLSNSKRAREDDNGAQSVTCNDGKKKTCCSDRKRERERKRARKEGRKRKNERKRERFCAQSSALRQLCRRTTGCRNRGPSVQRCGHRQPNCEEAKDQTTITEDTFGRGVWVMANCQTTALNMFFRVWVEAEEEEEEDDECKVYFCFV